MAEFSENAAERMDGLTREIEHVLTEAFGVGAGAGAFRKVCAIRRDFLPARYRVLVAGTNGKKRAFLNNLLRGVWGNPNEIRIPAELSTRVLDKPDGMFIPENGVIPERDEIFRIAYRKEPEASALFPDGHITNVPLPLWEDFSAAAPNLLEMRIGWPVFWGEAWEMVALPDWRTRNRAQSVFFPYLESADMLLLLLEPALVKTEEDTAWMMPLLRLPDNCRTIPLLFQPAGEGEAVPDAQAEFERVRGLFQAYLHKYLFFATESDAGRLFFQKGRAILQADALALREGMEREAAPALSAEMQKAAAEKPEYAVVPYAAKALERVLKEERARLAESPQAQAGPDDSQATLQDLAALQEKFVSLLDSYTERAFSTISPWVFEFRRTVALHPDKISVQFEEALKGVNTRDYRAFSAKLAPVISKVFLDINKRLQEHENAGRDKFLQNLADELCHKVCEPVLELLAPYPPLQEEFQKAWGEFLNGVKGLQISKITRKFYWARSPLPTAQVWHSHSGSAWIMPYISLSVEQSVKAFSLRQNEDLKDAMKRAEADLKVISAKLTQDFGQAVAQYGKTAASRSPAPPLVGRIRTLETECRKLYEPEERRV